MNELTPNKRNLFTTEEDIKCIFLGAKLANLIDGELDDEDPCEAAYSGAQIHTISLYVGTVTYILFFTSDGSLTRLYEEAGYVDDWYEVGTYTINEIAVDSQQASFVLRQCARKMMQLVAKV